MRIQRSRDANLETRVCLNYPNNSSVHSIYFYLGGHCVCSELVQLIGHGVCDLVVQILKIAACSRDNILEQR